MFVDFTFPDRFGIDYGICHLSILFNELLIISVSVLTLLSVWMLARGGRSCCWWVIRITPFTIELRVASLSTAAGCGWMTGRGQSVGGTMSPDTHMGSWTNRWVKTTVIKKHHLKWHNIASLWRIFICFASFAVFHWPLMLRDAKQKPALYYLASSGWQIWLQKGLKWLCVWGASSSYLKNKGSKTVWGLN